MSEIARLEEKLSAVERERAGLQSALEQVTADLAAVTAELDETNKGVVALYSDLDEQAAQLRAATELKSRFLSYMSHEFRTPLGAIRSMSRILIDKMDGPLTAEQDKQVRFIQSAAVELNDMVSDLLDLAKVEAGRVTISPAWFEMVDLMSALRGMFKPIVASESIALIFEEPKGIARVFTDDKKLSQILRNFISNALKFTTEGEVRVSVTSVDNDEVRFSVKDTGIGIAKEHQAALFNDFTQIDSPIQKRLRGTGLGLSLSKRLAELLGGTVSVESDLGKGSTFSVTIPARMLGHEKIPSRESAEGQIPDGGRR